MLSLGFKPVGWMVNFSAVHLTLLNSLICHCQPTASSRGPLTRLGRLVKFSSNYQCLMCAYYVFTLAKYALIWLLGFEWLHDYRLLDCLLIGRFNFIGRTMKIGQHICKLAAGMFLFYRTRVASQGHKLFKFHCLEFLLYDYNDILVNEIQASDRSQGAGEIYRSTPAATTTTKTTKTTKTTSQLEVDNPNTSRRFRMANFKGAVFGGNRTSRYEFLEEHEQLTANEGRPRGSGPLNGNFYLRNPFSTGQDEQILRLNRTSKSWLTLAKYANFTFYCSVSYILLQLGLIGALISGSIMTKIGFELNYPTCVKWLREQQQQQQQNRTSSSYTFIYTVDPTRRLANEWHIDSLPFRIPLDDAFQGVTVHRLLAITYDILENHFWYLDFFGVFIGMAFVSYLMTIDLLINSGAIKSRLKIIIAEFHERTLLIGPRDKYSNLESCKNPQPDSANKQRRIVHQAECCALGRMHAKKSRMHDSDAEISQIQAILLDHFNMTRDYNSYTAFFLLYVTCGWSSYTIIICFWMGIVRSESIEFEFAWAEAFTFVLFLFLLVGPASLRTSNYRLYALITDAMALDDNLMVSKERWSMIIQYFYPKPMFCFTLFSSIELSWLFCLKLTSWIISAILVLANFFYMYKA